MSTDKAEGAVAAASLDIELDGSEVLTRPQGIVGADVDGERVILSPVDFAYFGLKGAGSVVWDSIDSTASLNEIVSDLESRFPSAQGMIRQDCLDFAEALLSAGLASITD